MKLTNQYLKIVKWSEEDQCYVGYCPGLMLGGVHGDNEVSVYQGLCEVVDEWLQIHNEENLPLPLFTADKNYTGKFVLRISPELHERLTIQAMLEGDNLNSYCKKVLENAA